MSSPLAKSSAIPALTGLRGYAALWVLLSHLSFTTTFSLAIGERVRWKLAEGLLRHEYLAVDLFFVLSGFVLTHAHARELDARVDRRAYGRFLLLRLARVYPLHITALLLVFLVNVAFPSSVRPTDTGGALTLHVLMMSSWGFVSGLTWNDPAWSLSSEWLAYLVLPPIVLATAGLKSLRAQLATLALLAAGFGGLFFGLGVYLTYAEGVGATGRVLFGVALGSVLRRLYDQPRVRALPWGAMFWLALPLAAACMTEWDGRRRDNNLASYLAVVFIVFAAACARPRAVPLLSLRPAVYLGEISYAIYIFHFPVLRLLGLLFDGHVEVKDGGLAATFAPLIATAAVGLTILVAALAHHAIEEPVRRWARARIDARWPAGTPLSTVDARATEEAFALPLGAWENRGSDARDRFGHTKPAA